MTSKQVMLMTATLVALAIGLVTAVFLGGCDLLPRPVAEELVSPYRYRHVWAVAPLENESGSIRADGVYRARLADHLQQQLEGATHIDVLPVNRTIEAMSRLGIASIDTPEQATLVMQTLGVDGLVIGTITAYDPYDPPTLGMALELHMPMSVQRAEASDLRHLSTAQTEDEARLHPSGVDGSSRPVQSVSAVLKASDPQVRAMLQRYGSQRASVPTDEDWHRYRMSMDLYSEFAAYVMSWRLMDAERRRLTPGTADSTNAPPAHP